MVYSPWGHKQLDPTQRLHLMSSIISCFLFNSPLLPWGILNPSTRGTVCVSKQMALFFASFPRQGVRDRGNKQQWVLLPLAFHLARSRLCPISTWLLPVDPVVFRLCEINIMGTVLSLGNLCSCNTFVHLCVCVCVNAHPVPCFAEFYTSLKAFNVGQTWNVNQRMCIIVLVPV